MEQVLLFEFLQQIVCLCAYSYVSNMLWLYN